MKARTGTISNGAKAPKMVIKAFKTMPSVSADYNTSTRELLRSAIQQIYDSSYKTKVISYEQLYRAVDDMCLQKQEEDIYRLLRNECRLHIEKKVNVLLASCGDNTAASQSYVVDQMSYLTLCDSMWKDHCDQLNTIRNVFIKLDRSYCLQQQNGLWSTLTDRIIPITDMGNKLLRGILEEHKEVLTKMVSALLAAVECYRQGENLADKFIIGRLCHLFLSLDIYKSLFEPAFLLDSQRFFKDEGALLIHSADTAIFLAAVDKRLAEAGEMTSSLLHVSSKKFLFETIEKHLLLPHTAYLIEKGLSQMLSDNRIADLKRMFLLFDRVSSLSMVKAGWTLYIRQYGEALVSNKASESYVEDVLKFQEKLDNILKNAFFNEESLRTSLKSGFEHFLNLHRTQSAELLAKYLDKKLRGEKGVSETDTEALFDKAMVLFRYLQEKDIFEAFYKKHLAKRLLLGKSASYELEKSMLSKLKTECGSNFTAKLEGMFQDVDLSRECQLAFQNQSSSNSNSSSSGGGSSSSSSSSSTTGGSAGYVDMQVQVLTTGYWPTPAAVHTTSKAGDGGRIVLPLELRLSMDKFETFYANKYQGRRLLWAHSLERCIVAARFPKGKKDLEVSLFQALILKCFNKADTIPFGEIAAATGIEDSELRRTLQSLANGQIGTRVLTKEPKGKDVLDGDVFHFNEDFTNKLFRIKINTIQLKETAEENEKTHEDVFRDREYQVDAAIVRTMKARKRLLHSQLIAELLTQLRFPAQTSDLKKRIESLIEREYLERDKDDSTYYNYLA